MMDRFAAAINFMCITYSLFVFFLPVFLQREVFFHSRVIGACPATTYCIVLRRWVDVRTTTNNSNNSDMRWEVNGTHPPTYALGETRKVMPESHWEVVENTIISRMPGTILLILKLGNSECKIIPWYSSGDNIVADVFSLPWLLHSYDSSYVPSKYE